MESIDCLFCGSADRRVRYLGFDRLCGVPGEFTLVECARCGFLYLSPRPDETEIDRFYPAEYAVFGATVAEAKEGFPRRIRQRELSRRCEIVRQHVSSGSLLDVGAGVGDFLASMRSLGNWDVRGLEPMGVAAARARRVYGLNVDEGRVDDVAYHPGSFDVITLWEVLEHLPRPREAVGHIFDLLRPGGVIVMSLPNRDSLGARLFGAAWCGLDVPRHFSVFRRKDVARMLIDAGFATPEVMTPGGPLGSAHNELSHLLISLIMLLRGDSQPGPLRRRALRRLLNSAPNPVVVVLLFLATLPFSWTVRLLNRGSQMVVVARKPASPVD